MCWVLLLECFLNRMPYRITDRWDTKISPSHSDCANRWIPRVDISSFSAGSEMVIISGNHAKSHTDCPRFPQYFQHPSFLFSLRFNGNGQLSIPRGISRSPAGMASESGLRLDHQQHPRGFGGTRRSSFLVLRRESHFHHFFVPFYTIFNHSVVSSYRVRKNATTFGRSLSTAPTRPGVEPATTQLHGIFRLVRNTYDQAFSPPLFVQPLLSNFFCVQLFLSNFFCPTLFVQPFLSNFFLSTPFFVQLFCPTFFVQLFSLQIEIYFWI